MFDSGSDDESGHEEEDQEAVRAALSARYSGLFSLDLGLTQVKEDREPALQEDGAAVQPDEEQEQEAPEFEFRLFAAQGASTQRVVLPTPAELEGPGGGGLVKPRPVSYHLRAELGPEELERIRFSALTGREVIEAARQRAWGLEKPWRVVRILLPTGAKLRQGPAASTGSKEERATTDGKPDKRKRPGKQRRIATRKREKARKEKEAEEREKRITKEEHLKEKKKRLNREKKLKRRQKDRDKKTAANTAAAGDERGSDAGSDLDAEGN